MRFILFLCLFSWVQLVAISDDIVLHSYWRSSCSWRVRIALELKQIPYKYVSENFVKPLSDEFVTFNPSCKLPVLLIDNLVLSQSAAIIEYLEEARAGHALLPDDLFLRAKVRQIVQMIACDTQPLQNQAVLLELPYEMRESWAKRWISKSFDALEKVLDETCGVYCVGDTVTMADIFLVPQVYNARRYGVDLTCYPNIVRLDSKLALHEAFKKAHANVQPDAPD